MVVMGLQNLHETDDKVREIISEKLKMDHRKIEVEHAHETGKPTTSPGDRPRPIVVRFLTFKDKVSVLERVKNFRGMYTVYLESIQTP